MLVGGLLAALSVLSSECQVKAMKAVAILHYDNCIIVPTGLFDFQDTLASVYVCSAFL